MQLEQIQNFENSQKTSQTNFNRLDQRKRNDSVSTLLKHDENSLALNLIRSGLYENSKDLFLLKSLATVSKKSHNELLHYHAIKTICEIEPGFQNFYHLGLSYYVAQKDEDAAEALEKALFYPTNQTNLLFEVYKLLGNLSVKARDLDSAYELYSKAWSIDDRSDVLHVNLGTLMVQKNDLSQATEYFRKALEINPQNDKAWVGLALNHQKLGDFVLAQANIENALEIAPDNRTAIQIAVSLALPELRYQWVSQCLQNYLYHVQSDSEISILLIHVFIQLGSKDLARLECERALLFDAKNELLLQVMNELC